MKSFNVYQHLSGEPMSDRDKLEENSKFWGEGKWNNFVKPFLKEPGILVDMGCNAGLFLKLAEDMGNTAIGVDSDKEAVTKGEKWRDKNGYKYEFLLSGMENVIDQLPMSDYTVLANAHYYFYIKDWLDYLDRLQNKTRYCIIVTADKMNKQPSVASADPQMIRRYFKNWDEVGFIEPLPTEGDPSPRKLWGMCFKSRNVDRIPMTLDRGNGCQDSFYGELDAGKDYHDTRYYKILKKYRQKWSQGKLDRFMEGKVKLYKDIRWNGQLEPVIVSNNRVLDGNHRYSMMKHLSYQSCFGRIV